MLSSQVARSGLLHNLLLLCGAWGGGGGGGQLMKQ